MKVILLKSVPKVGKKDEIIEVSQGYAQNALFPKKLAVLATPAAIDTLEKRKLGIVVEKEMRYSLLDKTIVDLNGQNVQMKIKANAQGNLFSKIHEADIAKFLLGEHRISLDSKLIVLKNGPIKKLGSHEIFIEDDGYSSKFTIELIQE